MTSKQKQTDKNKSSKSQTQQVYEEIKWRIISDELRSGILLTEKDIVEMTGFGKAPIRAALMELRHNKLIDVVRRKGFFVRPWSAEEADQLLYTRSLIEPELAARAAVHANEEERNGLVKTVSDAAVHVSENNRRALIVNDNDFHLGIARASGNSVGAEIVELLKLRSHYLWHISISSQQQLESVQKQHENILDAILNKNPEAAALAMRQHLLKLDPV